MASESHTFDTLSNRPYEDGLHPVVVPDGLQVDPSPRYEPKGSLPSPYYPTSEQIQYDPTKEAATFYASELPSTTANRICGLRRRNFWIVLAIVAIIIIAAAVGGGVGGVLSKHNTQAASSPPMGDSGGATTVTVIGPSSTFVTSIASSTSTTTSSSSGPTGTSKPGYCAKLVPNWIFQDVIAAGIGRDGAGVRFADLTGDGRVEYLYVETNGAVTAYLNLGSPDPNPLNAGKIDWLAQGVIATGVGGTRNQIRFADLDGDGKADYLWVHDDGSVDAWLNGGGPNDGADAAKVTWYPQGKIATGIGKDGTNLVFADVNGDGRADYLWLDPQSGDVTAYMNMGPLVPNNRASAGQVGWNPVGIIATGFTVGSGNQALAAARFADMNGDGRADYCELSYVNGNVSVWQNTPGKGSNITWIPTGVIAAGVGDDGRTVQFGDLNGDGRWDYLDVNITSGAVTAWLNGC